MQDRAESGRYLLDHAIVLYYDDAIAAVRRRGLSQVQPAEIVHDLYLLLARNPDQLAQKTSLRAFLLRAAINLGIDRARRITFEHRIFAALDQRAMAVLMASLSLGESGDAEKRVMVLKAAIAALPRQSRTAFIAYRIGGMTKDEIAGSMGIQRRMVDRHIRNALMSCLQSVQIFD